MASKSNGNFTPAQTAALNDYVKKTLETIATIPSGRRSPGQARKLRTYYLATHAPPDIRDAYRLRHELRKKRQQLVDEIPTTMVMREMSRDSAIWLGPSSTFSCSPPRPIVC